MSIEHNDSDNRVFPYQKRQQNKMMRKGKRQLDLRHKKQWPYQEHDYQDPYGPRGLTMMEMVDKVQNNLRVSCRLPKIVQDEEIERIIVDEAAPFFYEEDYYAIQRDYYYVPFRSLDFVSDTGIASVFLPEEIQNVSYVFMVDKFDLFQIGTTPHALSVELGANQAYMPSYLQAIGDFGVYRANLEGFADMMNELFNRHAYKFSYDNKTGKLIASTEINKDLVLEVSGRIPLENLFLDNAFYRWVVGRTKVQAGLVTGQVKFNLPGGTEINMSDLVSQGKEEMKDAETRVNERSRLNPWFWMVRR